ncbi:hypothetical protein NSK_002471 [Nannochloropsis salina CCMP1776]|uniref:Uncharacterized protein n=1 Tax=Nannochloropsis salina CCMP1776 TaxID=1027361 RepID=A0A4D9D8D7_9STRA|nr:hypothetical protein NSK_002471 [Nannochloropsis salina CCMP1776]|eukprot:TFJ86263.1 hypothetical protein NSK_002471 [Nannochloropsis salina CCMP1776]
MWWTPAHKSEFISLWASLTCRKTFAKYFATARTKSTSDLNHYQGVRAYFDVVDEYVRSLEYYREKQNPRDEDLADIVLRIAEFLLEYAMLGHEDLADVPTFLHPTISHDNLRSIGVPVLAIDANGEARLTEPRFQAESADTLMGVDENKAVKSETERQMYLSTGEEESVQKRRLQQQQQQQQQLLLLLQPQLLQPQRRRRRRRRHHHQQQQYHKHRQQHRYGQLPSKVEQQKQQQDQRINEEASRAINRMACELDDSIQLHRNEIDTLAQQKAWQERALSHLSNELVDLERVGLGSVNVKKKYELTDEKLRKTADMYNQILLCNKNLAGVLLIKRHFWLRT